MLNNTDFSVFSCVVRALHDFRCVINETPNKCRSVFLLRNTLCSDRDLFVAGVVCLFPVVVASVRDSRLPYVVRVNLAENIQVVPKT